MTDAAPPGRRPRYALISMPWFWAYLPSIQLAIVKDALGEQSVDADIFEFYADLTDETGINLYKGIANDSGYIGELLFSQFYFDDHDQQYNPRRNDLGFATRAIQDDIFRFLTPVIENFLERCLAEADWSAYDAICFSLTASQSSASMAMARRIKARHPDIPVVFGGSSCAGDMGCALMELCREVDVVVHGEAEAVVGALVEAIAGRRNPASVPGISYRQAGAVHTNARSALHKLERKRGLLDFSSYFARVKHSKILTEHGVWVPFESSRGCWYGEKAQCTFCGLNEIIAYRERGSDGLLGELEHYADRYGVRNFFAVDLIMPRSFFSEFLPAVETADKGWTIFYEIKSNMRRVEIEQLSRAGVRWIQPGIESLDDHVLKIMRKGVSAAHNVQTLRLAQEQQVVASWNLITGFPREAASSYFSMAELFPKLHHLEPPVGLGDFEVHRFSPYFENPERLGVHLLGAFPTYRQVYPVEQSLLDRLVYRYAYELIEEPDPRLNQSRAAVRAAIEAWRTASKRQAGFSFTPTDGGGLLRDSRTEGAYREITISAPQAALLDFLDEMRPAQRLAEGFAAHDRASFLAIERDSGLSDLIERWKDQAILIELSGYILALCTRSDRAASAGNRSVSQVEILAEPVAA